MIASAHVRTTFSRLFLIAVICAGATALAAPPVFYRQINSVIALEPPRLDLRAGSLALGDFDGNNTMDAAVAGTYIGGVAVILNPGAQSWFDAGRTPVALCTADFDADGDLDLAVVCQGEGGVAILANDGAGQFTRTDFYSTGLRPQGIVAADLDKDSRVDLVVANRAAGTVSVLRNTGTGFAVQSPIALPAAVTPPVSSEPNALVAIDINGDSWLDVAVACAADDSVKILLSNSGTLQLAGTWYAGPYPVAVAAADLDGDQLPDLVAANRESLQLTVLWQDLAGMFTPQPVFLVNGPSVNQLRESAVDVLAADLNGDGRIDLRAANQVLYGDGSRSWNSRKWHESIGDVFAGARLPGDPGLFVGFDRAMGIYPLDNGAAVGVMYYPAAGQADPPFGSADFNGDGYVNVFDVLMLAEAWNRTQGEEGYDPRFDLDHDGVINVFDIFIVAEQWGRSPF